MHLRKSFLDFPIVWKSSMPVFSVSYQIIHGKFSHQTSLDYGRSTFIDVNDLRKLGKNYFSVLAFYYDFTWHKIRKVNEQKFFWGIGVGFENIEVKQKVSIAPGKYNQHIDEYMGTGPRITTFWKISQRKIRTGLDFSLTFTLPYASHRITRTDAAYSDRSYLWWIKLKANLLIQYRLSQTYSIDFMYKRDTWTYRTNHYKGLAFKISGLGGAFLLNSFCMNLNYQF